MTGKERIQKILRHEKTDRIGIQEHFWGDTIRDWTKAGHIPPDTSLESHFNFDIIDHWPGNLTADIHFKPQTVQETEETITLLDGNGAILRRHKLHDTTPEHIGYTVRDREGWDKMKHMLVPTPDRLNFEGYRAARKRAHDEGRYLTWGGVNVFEAIHPLCGHENMLIGMALDPEWVAEMAETYARLIVDLQKMLFEAEGYPDGIWYYEDMGFKERPFMSPDMYERLIEPYHKYTIDYAKSVGLQVIMHSCGYIEPLLPGMIRAGIDCLHVIEIKAGMDLLKLWRKYGDDIAFCGGIDVRTLYTNDLDIINAELSAKIPVVKEGFNYILHSDHSIPNTVHYDTYRYFLQRGIELGTY